MATVSYTRTNTISKGGKDLWSSLDMKVVNSITGV